MGKHRYIDNRWGQIQAKHQIQDEHKQRSFMIFIDIP